MSRREMEVMTLLWKSDTPYLASEIARISSTSINTVNVVLKNLLNAGMIEIADIVHSGTVLSRRYRPNVDPEVYTTELFIKQFKDISPKLPTTQIVSRLLEEDVDRKTIDELEELVHQHREKLEADS
ncbi:penicillinase repressor [Anaerotruncus sp. X29]|nr:BlaI/MecI/CopY family transcriptional regulator [Anaerotruncus sp. 1XD42-93]MCI9161028.1 penicillinase repressor [Anaerotruncus sp.]NCE76388.1 penicillinase repressor [Anaerotruncus sp. X29]RKJ93756.1 penicillinase repressor [Anaerotruncus sp. 1XD22-93]MCI9236365.1 penicillinase repressor [Anaerotruncus sp.]NBK17801.1 penicillinase repressor [Anaerotruncus sp. 1XD42-93]